MTRKQQQDEISRCSKEAFMARQNSEDERRWLGKAIEIRPVLTVQSIEKKPLEIEPGYYFIGEALRRRRDPRCRNYLMDAVRQSPTKPRAYLRLLQSLFLPGKSSA